MKWIDQMIKHITNSDSPLNSQFRIQRHNIVCQSGTTDYVNVTIDNKETFSFDFWTKELTFEYGCRYFEEISATFKKLYGNIIIIKTV